MGQFVAETIRFYGDHFWRSLALGLAPAVLDAIILPELSDSQRVRISFIVAPIVLTASYVAGTLLVSGRRVDPSTLGTGLLVGLVVFIPLPLLIWLYFIPGGIWLALFGLAVPAAVVERRKFYGSLKRGLELSLSGFLHALGSVLTLTALFFMTRLALEFALRGGSDIGTRVAAFLADLVLTPILFLGLGMLYLDQLARVGSGPPTDERSSDADLHPALEADRPGRPDAEVESRSPTGGQP
ncbi:MAG: hypothetical protein M3R70_01970 [Actinomycetota bacterium]|nr:hypothetical protein [Actinomycetota bacterium]